MLNSCLLIIEGRAKEKQIAIEQSLPGGSSRPPCRSAEGEANPDQSVVERRQVHPAAAEFDRGQSRAGSFVTLIITDNGIGMTIEELEIAIRPFGQVECEPDRTHEGTGLGLPISVALARLHGGDIRIDSQKGKGTRVSLDLPTHS